MILESELLPDDRIERRSNTTICQEHDRLCDSDTGSRLSLRQFREGRPEPMQGVDLIAGRKSDIGQGQVTKSLEMRGGFSDQVFDVGRVMLCLSFGSSHRQGSG